MEDKILRVLTGLLFNNKAIDFFVHKAFNEKIFFEYSTRTGYSFGSREARFLAHFAVKYYEKYIETGPWSYFASALEKLKSSEEKVAAYLKIYDSCEAIKDMKHGEWREQLDSLVADYRQFKHKDTIAQSISLYELTCIGNPGSRSEECKVCDYADECKEVKKTGANRSAWLLDWCSHKLDAVKMSTNAADIKIYKVNDLLDEALEIYEEDRKDVDEDGYLAVKGIGTPFPSLTKATGGWMQGRLYMIWSRSGVGKSAFLLQCANEAVSQGYSVLYFNLEMPTKEELIHRIMAYTTKTEFTKLMKRQIDNVLMGDIKKRLKLWKDTIKDANYFIADLPKQTKLSTIFDYSNKFITKNGRKVLILIDYLGLLHIPYTSDATAAFASMSEGLHSYARDESIAMITAGQLNRSADGARRITARHTRDCDKIIDNTDGSWALVPISDMILRLQKIKGRYFDHEDILLEKHLWRMGFEEYHAEADESTLNGEGGLF